MIKFNVYQTIQQPDDKLLFQMLASFYSYDDASAFADTYPDADVMAYDDEMDVEYDGDDEDEE
jgi:hypothetical protein